MNLLRSRRRHHLPNIPRRNPTPRQNNNPSARTPHQLRNPLHRLRCRHRSPRSQQPSRFRSNHILQRLKQIRTLIERPMKRHRQRRSRPHQFRRPHNINSPIHTQQTQHNSIHPSRPCHINRRAHLLKLRRRINKIPAARSHHREYRHAHRRAHNSHQLHARRNSTNLQQPTQFNPRSPAALRRNRPLHTLHRNLNHSSARHRFSPFPNFSFPSSNFFLRFRISNLCLVIVLPSRKPQLVFPIPSRRFSFFRGRTCVKENVV